MAVQATEPAPYSGDLRIKIRWTSNDYDRVHQLFIMKVDARGQVIYNLTIQAVIDGAKTYFWAPVDPEDYQYQLTPLLEIEQGMANQLYQSLLEHLIHKGHMAPPSTTEAEDVERKMLMSENAFLKELLHTIAGTRKSESWRTTSMTDLSNKKLDKMAQVIDEEMRKRRREPQAFHHQAGTPTISSGSGSTGQGSQGFHSGSKGLSAQGGTLGPRGIPSGGLPDDTIRWSRLDQAELRKRDSNDHRRS